MIKRLLIVFAVALFNLNLATAQTAPDFSFTDINGETHTLSESLAEGKVIMLDFFFVNCGTCVQLAPEIDQIIADYEGTTVEVWMISDRDSDAAIAGSIFNSTHTNHKVGGSDGGGAAVIDLYAANFSFLGFPTYSIVCNDGSITWDPWPITAGANEIRSLLTEDCGVETLSTSVASIEGLSEVEAYPNPAVNNVSLEFELDKATNMTIEVMNTLGQVVKSIPAQDYNAGNQIVNLDVAALATGIYVVSMQSAKGVHTIELSVTK